MNRLLFIALFFLSTIVSAAGYQFWTADQPDTQGIAHYEWTADGGTTVTAAAMEPGSAANTVKMVSVATSPGQSLQARACIVSGECGPWSNAVTVLPGQPTVIIQWSN